MALTLRQRTPGPVGMRYEELRSRGPLGGPLYAEAASPPSEVITDAVTGAPVYRLDEPSSANPLHRLLEECDLPLWTSAPQPEDAVQGDINDCALVSTLIALAHARNAVLQAMIREEPAAVFCRRRGETQSEFPWRARRILRVTFPGQPEVIVSSLLYRYWGRIAYARSRGDSVSWVSFLEKAYVVGLCAQSYAVLDAAGEPEARGGRGTTQIFTEIAGPAAVLDLAAEPRPSLQEVRRWVERALERPTIAGTESAAFEPAGIAAGHAYAVLGLEENRVILRDPRGGERAEKRMALDDFREVFRLIWQTAG